MGFEVYQIVSDEKHYGPLVCRLCQRLCSLDALVTDACSHPFCRACLEAHVASSRECPTCQKEILVLTTRTDEPSASSPSPRHVMLNTALVAALPLETAQPLAYQVLCSVQVACILKSKPASPARTDKETMMINTTCEWVGDYVHFANHTTEHHGSNGAAAPPEFALTTPIKNSQQLTTFFPEQNSKARPTMRGLRSLSTPSVWSADVSESTLEYTMSDTTQSMGHRGDDSTASKDDSTLDMLSPRAKFRRSKSLKDMGMAAPSISIDELRQNTPPKSQLTSKAAAAKLGNGTVSSPPVTSQRDTPPAMVHRTVSGDGMAKGTPPQPPSKPTGIPMVDEPFGGSKSKLLGASYSGAAKKIKPPLVVNPPPTTNSDSDLEVSYSHALDWNMSINSFGGLNGSNNDIHETNARLKPMDTLKEDEEQTDFQLEFEPESHDEPSTRKIFDKAEKLKKQANAKFNKGDFSAARTLYTVGINVMQTMTAVSQEERELLAGMHSNRGVTYFREKKFQSCIEDCEKAISYDPSYDKSWIRKWRAHMALGDFDGAYQCLETANKLIPDSKKIQDEFASCQRDKELLTTARQFLIKKDYEQIREVLRPHATASDNINLLFLAARADAYLGHTESALEKINKALRFNPMHAEGLELRGHTLFLAGETEKGAHLLQEALNINKDSKLINKELSRCQKTHTSFQKGRASVKRGRYAEAVDHFSQAIKDSGNVPSQTPLFSSLRIERAEGYLLCNRYVDACKDCQEVINAQPEHATAWSVRADILVALGESDQAKKELKKIRKTWGFDNATIGDAYKRVDFELRVRKADDDLETFLADLESGRAKPLFVDEEKKSRRKRGTEHATAWSVRADILVALGESDQAKKELKKIRKTWGFDNATIGDAYKRVDFELRVRKADDDLETFLADLESGRAKPLFVDEEKKSRRKEGHRKNNRSCSSIEYEADLDPKNPNDDKEKKRNKIRRSLSRNRSRSRGDGSANESPGRARSQSARRDSETPKRGGFVPPPSIEDMTNGDDEVVPDRRSSTGPSDASRSSKRDSARKRS